MESTVEYCFLWIGAATSGMEAFLSLSQGCKGEKGEDSLELKLYNHDTGQYLTNI